VKRSISVTSYSWEDGPQQTARHLRELATLADEAGLDTLWVPDHLLQMDPSASPDEPMLEAYTTLGYLAAATTRVQLGTLVTWATIRPPALVVKLVTTLDVLSGGRAWLGVGIGYREDEATMTGLPFPPTAERYEQLEELLQLADRMWGGDRRPFEGPHHHLREPIGEPRPLRRPPVLIGGTGEQRTLPLVARYADACNLFDVPDGGATVARKLEVLTDSCARIGRDPDEIEVTLASRVAPGETPAQLAARCRELEDRGIDHVIFLTTGPWRRGGDLDVILEAA
jgi:F420-dependent oxidoreductase-like protein